MKLNFLLFSLMMLATSGADARISGLALGGTNIGGGLRASQYSEWCLGQFSTLQSARLNALRLLDRRGPNATQGIANRGAAIEAMIAGLEAASVETPTLTGVASKRGARIFRRMMESSPTTVSELDLILNAVDEYYSFIIKVVYEKLDRAVIPQWINQIEHSQQQFLELEKRYLEYVAGQLSFLNTAFASKNDSNQVFPDGKSEKFYLLAGEIILSDVAADLNGESLYGQRHACLASELTQVLQALKRENTPNNPDKRFLFLMVYRHVEQAVSQFKVERKCL